jgi:hypothetical protein
MVGAIEGAVVMKLQGPSNQRFFLVAKFRHLGTQKKRADESNKENFGNLKKNRHILRKKR